MRMNSSQLQQLNRMMLGLGAPTERDDIGYNQPDYLIMRLMGSKEPSFLSPEEQYNICQILEHYKNTQLRDYASQIEETKVALENTADQEIIAVLKQDRGYLNRKLKQERRRIQNEKRKKAGQLTVSVKEQDPFYVLVSFTGYNPDLKAYVQDNKFIRWQQEDSKWYLRIEIKGTAAFAEFMADHGYDVSAIDSVIAQASTISVEKMLRDYFFLKPLNIKGKVTDEQYGYIKTSFYQETDHDKAEEKKKPLPAMVSDKIRDFAKLHGYLYNAYPPVSMDIPKEEIHYLTDLISSFGFATRIDHLLDDYIYQAQKRSLHSEKLIDTGSLSLPFVPFPFQIEDAKTLLKKKRAICGNEMGTGKTFVHVLVGESIPKRKLVVCPVTLTLNWRKEIRFVNPAADIRIINAKDKKPVFSDEWNVIGYPAMVKFADQLKEAAFDVIFFDEAHYCKAIDNKGLPSTKRAKTALLLASEAEYCYPMTGTPMPTSTRDLYNLLAMINHKITKESGKWSFFEFGKHYCNGEQTRFGWDFSGNSNTKELNDLLRSDNTMIRRLRRDVMPNLSKQRTFIPVEVPQAKIFRKIKELLKGEDSNFLAYSMVCRRLLSEEKLAAVYEMTDNLLEQEEPVVIITGFKNTVKAVKEKYGDDCVIIEGGMSSEKKQESVDKFQAGKARVCVANIIAAGVGITLTKSCNLIMTDFDFTPANLVQAEDRICRGGQTRPCNIYYIYAENIDIDNVFCGMLSRKFSTINEAIDANEGESVDMLREVEIAVMTSKLFGYQNIIKEMGGKKG